MCVICVYVCCVWFSFCTIFFFFKQKTAYEMRISDWSSDVCSSDLSPPQRIAHVIFSTSSLMFELSAEFPMLALILTRKFLPMKIGRASCRERVCQYV